MRRCPWHLLILMAHGPHPILRKNTKTGLGVGVGYVFLPTAWAIIIFLSLVPTKCCLVFFRVFVIIGIALMLLVWAVNGALLAGM